MSLISLKNLAGPFRSKLQMGALVIVVILVLVIRVGTSRTGDGAQNNGRAGSKAASSSDELLKVLDEAQRPNTKSRPPVKANDELLEGLVEEGLDDRPQKQVDSSAGRNEAFEDIRKSLGLE